MSASDENPPRCRTCGGVWHPATGNVYRVPRSPRDFHTCGPCTREAWKWIRQHTAGKGRRKGPSFYESVGVIGAKIVVES
jgi:hypothetical protein